LRIRLASKSDAAVLSRLAQQTFCETFTHYDPADRAAFLATHYSADVFASYLSDPKNKLWLIEDDGTPLGYAKLGAYKLPLAPTLSPVTELHRLYVLKSRHGKGVGSALMETVFESAAQHAKILYLGVWEKNTRAQDFYKRYGFEKVGEYDYLPIGNVVDREWIMMKAL
jgi:diamine N-acetyltransferase